MSVRLKSGRSPVRSRPWPQVLAQLRRYFAAESDRKISGSGPLMGPKWGQTSSCCWPIRSCVPVEVVERIQSRGDVIEFVIEKIGVCMGGHRDGGMTHRLLQEV